MIKKYGKSIAVMPSEEDYYKKLRKLGPEIVNRLDVVYKANGKQWVSERISGNSFCDSLYALYSSYSLYTLVCIHDLSQIFRTLNAITIRSVKTLRLFTVDQPPGEFTEEELNKILRSLYKRSMDVSLIE